MVNPSVGALIIHRIGVIVTLWLGGLVAGRFTPSNIRSTAWLHGFIVWCAAAFGGVLAEQSGETITSFVDEAVSDLSADAPGNEGIRARADGAITEWTETRERLQAVRADHGRSTTPLAQDAI